MDFYFVLTLVFNTLIWILFNAGLGFSVGLSSAEVWFYRAYTLGLFVIPVGLNFLRMRVTAKYLSGVLTFLSLTYFIWGYVLTDLLLHLFVRRS